ncbi:MAG: hypothetical protein MRY83_14565 [Flavobacteriales bacterium]|nr:hypothetical protein [Flavobacteriales bacterium]
MRLSFLLLLIISLEAQAQWSVGYFAPYVVNPGIKIGYESQVKSTAEDTSIANRSYHIKIGMGYFEKRYDYGGYYFGVTPGIRFNNINKKSYSMVGVSLAYLGENLITSQTINLAGETVGTESDYYHNVYTGLDLRLGKNLTDKIGIFLNLSGGYRLGQSENVFLVFFEPGINLNL